MSKELATSSETTVIETDLSHCVAIRRELIDRFDFLWLIVSTDTPTSTSATLAVSNAAGGKLEKTIADEVIACAQEIYKRLKS